MSIEYQAVFSNPIPDDNLEKIVSVLENSPDIFLMASQPLPKYTAIFRFVEEPLREVWSEDLVLEISTTSCYMAFYSGSRQQQKNFVNWVEEVITHLGYRCYFEEL